MNIALIILCAFTAGTLGNQIFKKKIQVFMSKRIDQLGDPHLEAVSLQLLS
jgi:hypothetical protein